ncbi:MAG: PEP-CTERM sorting domain-containing protein [Candidatus Omnitrophica bacterium]|nr:PEP-CTERM sorting domain-containing protein [Candidatus Omnitrophota bacterium]
MKKIFATIFILSFLFLSTGSAMAYTMDGNLGDWGVDPSTPGFEGWVPNPGIYYTVEDYVGPSGYVGPGWGGQKFDAEAMYLDWDDTNLYLALVTGFPRTGGVSGESAGDIGIDFGVDGAYEYAVEIKGHAPGYTGFNGLRGHVYNNISWATSSYFPESNPLYIADTGLPFDLGAVDGKQKRYNSGDPDYDRWVLEMSVPRSYFGTDWDSYMRVHWTQTCGNDNINVTTPEPMSMALFGSGLLGVMFGFRRKKKV